MSNKPPDNMDSEHPGPNFRGPGINLRKLDVPVRILVTTKNTKYDILLEESGGWATIQGGRYLPIAARARVNGCTFGGTAIMPGFLAPGMHMELYIPGLATRITTTRIQNACLIGEGWEFDMGWDRGRSGAA